MGSSHDKGKRLERRVGKFLLEYDGECPEFHEMLSSTGRAGQLTNLSIDVVTDNWAVECKNRESLPKYITEAWGQIQNRAEDVDKDPLLVLKCNREEPLYCVTEKTFKELIDVE